MKVSVYGNDLNALVYSSCLAASGNHVLIYAENFLGKYSEIVELTHSETNLHNLFKQELSSKRLKLSDNCKKTAEHGVIHILASTPYDIAQAKKIAIIIGQHSGKDAVFVNRTPFEIGVSELLIKEIHKGCKSCVLAVEPSFLIQGKAIKMFCQPARILIGTTSNFAITQLQELYKPYNRNHDVFMTCSPKAAELTKAATNAMIATRISFINEIANLAEHYDIDIEQVRKGLGSDPRIGYDYIYPGAGFGGPNFAADVKFLNDALKKSGANAQLLSTVLDINENQKEILFHKVWKYYKGNIADKTFCLWGLAYKPNTNICDNAHSINIATLLLNQNAKLKVYDPQGNYNFYQAMKNTGLSEEMLNNITLCSSALEAAAKVDAIILNTEWQEFWNVDLIKLKSIMKQPVFFDGRNIFEPKQIKNAGFIYQGIGR